MKHVGIANNLEVQAYVLSLVVRTIWVHIDDRLIEIEATSRVRVGDEEKMVPLSEYESTAKRLAELRSRTRTSAQAAVNRAEVEFEALTGVAWDAGGRRKGSPMCQARPNLQRFFVFDGGKLQKTIFSRGLRYLTGLIDASSG